MCFVKFAIITAILLHPLTAAAQISSRPPYAKGFSAEGLHLYPLGWSSEGRWGALIGRDNGNDGVMQITVIDAVSDKIIYESEEFAWFGPESFDIFWTREATAITSVAKSFDLESSKKPDVRNEEFLTGGLRYTFEMEPPSPAKGAYVLRINSARGDTKKIFSSSTAFAPQEARILGSLVSPFEQRAIAVILEREAGTNGRFFYRFIGAHLTLGFSSKSTGKPVASAASAGDLLMAVFNGQEYLVRSRLNAGADPNIRDSRSYSALLIAARLGHWSMVKDLLSAGALPDVRDKSGRTALHYAAFAGDIDAIRALLSAGADRNLRDGAGMKAINLVADASIRLIFE